MPEFQGTAITLYAEIKEWKSEGNNNGEQRKVGLNNTCNAYGNPLFPFGYIYQLTTAGGVRLILNKYSGLGVQSFKCFNWSFRSRGQVVCSPKMFSFTWDRVCLKDLGFIILKNKVWKGEQRV